MVACDVLTVETMFLQRIYLLFFISLATRRIEYVACSSNPDGRWVAQLDHPIYSELVRPACRDELAPRLRRQRASRPAGLTSP